MKFSCTQENLQHSLLVVGRIANKNNNLPILQNILIKTHDSGIDILATNLEIGVRTRLRGKVEHAGEFTLPAQLLTNYVALITNNRVDCELTNKEFHITADGQATIIKGELATDFPLLPIIDRSAPYTISKHAFSSGVEQTLIAAAVDESRPEIAGIFCSFENSTLTLAATDSYRLAEKTIPLAAAVPAAKVILPQRSAQELLRILQLISVDEVTVYLTENQFACSIGEVEFVSRVVEGKFPDYKPIIPQQGNTTVTCRTAAFSKAVKGAALFSKTGVNDIILTFSAADQTVTIKAVNAQLGQNTTIISGQVEGNDGQIIFNHRYVLDGLQHITGEDFTLSLVDQTSPGVFRAQGDKTYTYVIMPIKQ